MVWGTHDVTCATLRIILPSVPASKRDWRLTATRYAASAAAIGGVVVVREVLLPPPVPRLPPLPWDSATLMERVGLSWRSVERAIRYFPYRHRLTTVVACGITSGVLASLAEYRWLAARRVPKKEAAQPPSVGNEQSTRRQLQRLLGSAAESAASLVSLPTVDGMGEEAAAAASESPVKEPSDALITEGDHDPAPVTSLVVRTAFDGLTGPDEAAKDS